MKIPLKQDRLTVILWFSKSSGTCNRPGLHLHIQPGSLFTGVCGGQCQPLRRVYHSPCRGRMDVSPKRFTNKAKRSVEGPEYCPTDLCVWEYTLATTQRIDGDTLVHCQEVVMTGRILTFKSQNINFRKKSTQWNYNEYIWNTLYLLICSF